MPELTRAGPAQELSAYFQGYVLRHATSVADIDEMREITESDIWEGIRGPLMAVLVVDDSTAAFDIEVESAFGCGFGPGKSWKKYGFCNTKYNYHFTALKLKNWRAFEFFFQFKATLEFRNLINSKLSL